MPLVYADTSALFAYFYPRDQFSHAVDEAVKAESPDFVYWPLLRFELRHNLRRLKAEKYGVIAWRALRAAEKTAARLRWHGELTAEKILDSAEELSAEQAARSHCGSIDVLHVAAARRAHLLSGLDEFWTCDEAQAELSRDIGLPTRWFRERHEAAG
jgi:predicted nucleic acid-binding protein